MTRFDPDWMEAFAQRFLGKHYGRLDIEVEFGAAVPGTNPNLVQITPTDPRFSHIEVMMADVAGQRQPGAIHLELLEPVEIDLQSLIRRHGEPREAPRLHPAQPVPFAFLLNGPDYAGQLILGFAHQPLGNRQYRLRDLRVVRLAR